MSHDTTLVKVRVRDLSKAYGHTQAVVVVAFEIHAGEIFGLLGPNGAGKTTTVESIIGLLEPDSGTVEICGIDLRSQPQEAKQKIGAALQSTGLQDKITPREALRVFGSLYRTAVDSQTLLDRFGLTAKADAAFETLSGGQKQRLALALAFVNHPEVIVLDEPTAGLDPQMRRELHGHIREMKREGCSILLTTHDMEEAEQLCDRIAVLDGGRIVAEGKPNELIASSRSAVRISVQTSMPLDRDWLTDLSHAREIVCDSSGAQFTSSNVNRTLAELIPLLDVRQIEITGLRVARATLEDVILELTGASVRD
jgi:ABC-2 type transport system ATP-binding protein